MEPPRPASPPVSAGETEPLREARDAYGGSLARIATAGMHAPLARNPPAAPQAGFAPLPASASMLNTARAVLAHPESTKK
jgi:hypothetical protein